MEQFNLKEETNIDIEETKTDHLAPLKCVTPLSKYLSIALFIVLPFLGGWIGYQYAIEGVVDVEAIVVESGNMLVTLPVELNGDSNLNPRIPRGSAPRFPLRKA